MRKKCANTVKRERYSVPSDAGEKWKNKNVPNGKMAFVLGFSALRTVRLDISAEHGKKFSHQRRIGMRDREREKKKCASSDRISTAHARTIRLSRSGVAKVSFAFFPIHWQLFFCFASIFFPLARSLAIRMILGYVFASQFVCDCRTFLIGIRFRFTWNFNCFWEFGIVSRVDYMEKSINFGTTERISFDDEISIANSIHRFYDEMLQ